MVADADADAASFIKLSKQYGKDKNKVYWRGNVILEADPESFIVINEYYAKDRNYGYFTDNKLNESDGNSFEVLVDGWSRDADNYFNSIHTLNVCDYKTFQIIDEFLRSRAKDSECYYFNEKIVPIYDINSLEILANGWAKDKKAVYHQSWIIEGADPKTFFIPEKGWPPQDANNCFNARGIAECW